MSARIVFEVRLLCFDRSHAQVVSIVRDAERLGLQVKVVGSGHSFSSITLTDDDRRTKSGSVMLSLDKIASITAKPAC